MLSIHKFTSLSQPVRFTGSLNSTRPRKKSLKRSKSTFLTLAQNLKLLEFSPEDATRTELDFLLQVVQTAVDAGASYINIPDTVGFTTPAEYGAIFKYLIDHKQDRSRDYLFALIAMMTQGMAVANSLAAVKKWCPSCRRNH